MVTHLQLNVSYHTNMRTWESHKDRGKPGRNERVRISSVRCRKSEDKGGWEGGNILTVHLPF